ncbi:MAG: hypothetical protein ACLQAR_13875 [Steroidobacteraceae bacterium]
MINDARLGFDTRGFAAWLLARPPGWEIRASALPHLLKCGSRHVGRDKARRFLRELEQATYLTRTRRQGTDGRWIWDYAFRPTAVVSTIDALSVGGSPVDGSTVGGKGVDIIHTLNNSRSDNSKLNKTTTTTPAAEPVVVAADLVEVHYPDCLAERRLAAARKLIAHCPPEHRQAVLDELDAMLRDGVVRHPMGLLNELIESAKEGRFVPNRSLVESPTRAASNGSLTSVAGACSASSQPPVRSEIAEQTLSKWRSKRDPEAE